MKANLIILIIVIISAVYVGLNIINSPVTPSNSAEEEDLFQLEVPQQTETTSPIDPHYVMDYLDSIGFVVSPVFDGTTTDIYTAKYTVPDSYIQIQVDVYFERSSQQVLLVESNIDASWYETETNQQYYEDYVNEAALSLFSSFVTIPYEGSNPDMAREWVEANILTSYSSVLPEKTSTIIGPATINLFGSPLLRTLEIDFGF